MNKNLFAITIAFIWASGSLASAGAIRPSASGKPAGTGNVEGIPAVAAGGSIPTIPALNPPGGQAADAWAPIRGVYRGFSPTDESNVLYGELKVVVGKQSLRIAHATGLEVRREQIPLKAFEPISPDQTIPADQNIPDNMSITAFKIRNGTNMTLVFARDNVEKIVGGGIFGLLGDILGPTFFFATDPVSESARLKAMQTIEQDMPGSIPLLSTGGKAPNQ